MDFYYMIKNLEEEQINELISLKISELTYKAEQIPRRFIGVNCGINPTITLDGEVEHDSQAIWQGFIPEDVKIIYSFLPNEDGYTVNNGCYYYMDKHDYIYEFAKYIKRQNITDEIDFLTCVYKFIDNYFNGLVVKEETTREEMHKPLFDKNGKYIEPSTGHLFSDFKGSNNAMCSEYSAMAQNILSVFDYTMLYLSGSVNSPSGKGGHAYNLSLVKEVPCIIDFTIPVETYSLDDGIIDYSPFLGPIDDFSPESLRAHINGHQPFNFIDYYYLITKNGYSMITTGKERDYVVSDVEYYNEKNPKLSK